MTFEEKCLILDMIQTRLIDLSDGRYGWTDPDQARMLMNIREQIIEV